MQANNRKPSQPLVSILIYNYNYGRFLNECFDSALGQSYGNIEILFSDNASTDDSWGIALDYNNRYPGRIFLARNPRNYGAAANLKVCSDNIRGKYFLVLCSDDKLHPGYVQQTVALLESNLDAGMAIVHRAIIDEHGQLSEEAPFYNQTCKIPPPLQSAVYMMASVNPSLTQVIYRTDYAYEKSGIGSIGNRYHGARILDFNIASEYAVLYVKDALVYHRLHGNNDSFEATEKLIEVIGPYILNIEFAEIARGMGHNEVSERWEASVEKLSRLSLRYAASMLVRDKERLSKRYFHLALALFPEIEDDALFKKIVSYWETPSMRAALIQGFIAENEGIGRTISYDPPVGSLALAT